MKKTIIFTAALLLLLQILILPAAADTLDLNRPGSITATMVHEGQPVPGGTLTLYRTADPEISYGNFFRYVEEYADCGIALDDLGANTAMELAAYTYYQNIEGLTLTIGDDGIVKFENLTPGLYLLIQWEAAPGYQTLMPFLISVPSYDDGEYVYDITSAPKQEVSTEPSQPTEPSEPGTEPTEPTESSEPATEPSEPTEPKPSEPHLPQTGQTNWPVPVLLVLGLFFVIGGIILMRRDGKHDEA